ncbi:FAD-dependent oxidoreductase [Kribbia dieselivorans]|uniref:FAD-dependent oxidoreductase n=1 Tax=Kribbia dieselivorans TaxID=331526 RepID=UPI0008386663|nr:FAD-dependent oxidoreductase [Kribbia dieselivorans]
MNTFDVAVIGWGKGGKTIAGTLARAGRKVAIIEQSTAMYGGACINVACIPTKALIHSAEIRPDHSYDPQYFASAVERRDGLTGKMRAKNYSMLADLDTVVVFDGAATFTGPKTLSVTAGDDSLDITAETILINTGSLPNVPDIDGAEFGGRIHSSITLQHAPLPQHLIIVGGGYIGIEFASMFSQYGSQVTVLDRNPRPLFRDDEDVAAEVVNSLQDTGVRFVSEAIVERMSQDADSVTVGYRRNGEEATVSGDAVLIALGRHPNVEALNLTAAGVTLTDTGAVAVDGHLETSVPGIYALGDVNGGPQFTYVSLDDNRIVADRLLGSGTRSTDDRVAVPTTTFTTPPFSKVGLTEGQAREQGIDIKVATKKVAEIAAMPRPKIVGDPRGIIKIVVDAHSDLVLGASLVHVDSQEVINLVALAMRHGITATELKNSIYTHPSSTEALNEVLGTI